MSFDVSTLRGRRADQRWNRMSVGDILERVTWSTPDKTGRRHLGAALHIGHDLNAQGLDDGAYARERPAGYECPKKIVFATELPETVGGEIMKFRLRERLAQA